MKKLITILTVAALVTSCSTVKIPESMSKEEYSSLKDGLYAQMETNKGNMTIELFEQEAPLTVANFVGLAEGTKENKAKPLGTPYYDGIVFHRVIKDFMIQGGDPDGKGTGGPGYDFADEFFSDRKHDKKGILSMANAGPGTNGSQFFITEVPTPWLDGKHTIFGQVVDGLDVIDTIANVKKGAQDRPVEDVVINHVHIIKKGDQYKKYDGGEAFAKAEAAHEAKLAEINAKAQAEKDKEIQRQKDLTANAQKTESGLMYVIEQEGNGAVPKNGEKVKVHYTLRLKDGEKLDSSHDRNQPLDAIVGQTQLIKGWMEALTLFRKGSKVFLIIPADLGYGPQGAGGVIPPNATLYFDMEILE
ncbi:peptidylprolyl isomerase [Moheibacter lacus]|uniref:peptidylprolyl isomerase n=1 Tax=Moheibacter lacus TaxID=2745851 RepID=A0A838ZRS4_9FLAO|nr:peptidylprolyl isomerase [Moheibacter lacus]MBA5628479.1 peptidylprolyl isomerase [Moheibacter lacus]